MNTDKYAELRTRLSAVESGTATTDEAAAVAIAVYREAGAEVKLAAGPWESLQAEAKKIVEKILVELDLPAIKTATGQAFYASPRVSYDTKALDALCKSNDDYRRILEPHRIMGDKGALTIRS